MKKTNADLTVELIRQRGPQSAKQIARHVGNKNFPLGRAFQGMVRRGEIVGYEGPNPLAGEFRAHIVVTLYKLGKHREKKAICPSSLDKAVKLLERHGYIIQKPEQGA